MHRRTLRLSALLAVLLPATVQGAPRSISECETLKNDLAYNQCLAMFGPAAKNIGGDGGGAPAAPPPDEPATVAGIPAVQEPELREPSRRGRRAYRRGGRQSASFVVNAGSGDVADASSKRRSNYQSRRRR